MNKITKAELARRFNVNQSRINALLSGENPKIRETEDGYIDLDDEKVKLDIEIDKDRSMSAMPGHKVLVKVLGKLKDNHYKGEVIKILGHKNDPGVDILSIVAKLGIHDTFPEEVMEQVEALPDEVKKEELDGRRNRVT